MLVWWLNAHNDIVGSFDANDDDIGTGIAGAPACGDVMKLQVQIRYSMNMQIKVEGGKIIDAKFKTFGCGSAIASSSVASEWVKGKTLEEAMTIKNTDISNHLKLPPVKLHCRFCVFDFLQYSLLAEDAIKAAVNDYVKKTEKKEKQEQFQSILLFVSFDCHVALDHGDDSESILLVIIKQHGTYISL